MDTDNQAPLCVGDRATGHPPEVHRLFWLLLLFAPLALYLSGAIVALLFALVVACLWGRRDWRARIRPHRDGNSHWWLLLLLGYGLLSVGWARDSREAFYDWWRIALILGTGWVLVRWTAGLAATQCRYLLRGILWGGVLLIVLLAVEWLGGGQLGALIKNRDTSALLFTSRASALLAVLIWPMAVYCRYRKGRVAAGGLLLAALILIAALPILAASVAVLVSSAVFLCQRAWPRQMPRLLGAVFIVALLAAPWTVMQGNRYMQSMDRSTVVECLPSSWLHRLVIWEFFARRIQVSPWLGYGLGTAHGTGAVPAALRDYQRLAAVLGTAQIAAQPPLHPHNAALQLWHDLGLVGVLGASAWLLFALRSLTGREQDRNAVAACLASQTAWLIIAGLSFGLWQKWWLASGVINITISALLVRGLSEKGNDVNA